MSSDVAEQLLLAFRDPGGRQQALSLLSSVPGKSIIKDIRDTGHLNLFGDNFSLLHWAARWSWTDIIELLVDQYDCDPDCTTSLGWTMLHDACQFNHTATVQYLTTTLCMDPLQQDKYGEAPLDLSYGETQQYLLGIIDDAQKRGFKSVVDYLKHLRSAFTEAMEEGGGELFLSNIVLHGPPGAGKSSLKRIILGQPPLPKHKQNATDILEKSVRAVCTNRVAASTTSGLFEVVDNDQIIERLAGEVETHREKKVDKVFSNSPTQIDSSDSSISKAGSSASTSVSSDPDVAKVDFPSKDISSSTKAEESIKKKLLGTKTSSKMFDSRWHHYVDSGGQPQFLDVLPLLYSSPSHFIVVMRLTEGLDDKPKVRFYSQGSDVYELPDHLVLTNREMIVRMCQMAQSIARATSGKFIPRVFVMGTHIDQLWFFSRSKHLRKLNEELAPIYRMYSDVMICKSPEEFIFPLNAMAKGKERQQYTEEIQQHIRSATEKCGNSVTVPLKWLIFHLEIDKGEGVVRMSECYEVGEKLGMKKDRVHLALEFLNQAALILYYPTDVPDLVLTKMDPFTNRLSRLIKASFIPPDIGPRKECTELREKGVFEKSFLKRAFDGLEENLITDDEFLQLLVSLKVAVHIGGEEYFLPSALSLEPPRKGSSFRSGCISLALLWDGLILPHGFFLTVAVELLEKSGSEDDYVFKLRTDIAQWRGEIQVREAKGKIPGVVKLTDRKRWIQVSYSDDKSYSSSVHHVVNCATQRAVKRFQHTGMRPPTIGYLCPLCRKKDHYCYLSADCCRITCSENDTNTGSVTPDMLCWIQGMSGETKCYLAAPRSHLKIDKDQSLPSILNPVDDRILSVISEETEKVGLPQGQDREMQRTVPSSTTSSLTISATPAAGGRGPRRAPQLRDVHRLLNSKSHEWQKIGRDLGVNYDYRESLVKEGVMRSVEDKLEAVLNKWIESECSDVSWDNLIQVLKGLQFTDIARNVTSFVQTGTVPSSTTSSSTISPTKIPADVSGETKSYLAAPRIHLKIDKYQPLPSILNPVDDRILSDQSLPSILNPVDDRILSASDDNLLTVLRSTIKVTDWFTLGLTLGLPSHELERINRDGYDERDRQRRMVSLWLNTGGASWKALVQALIDPLVNEEDIAKRIAEQHPLNR